MNAFADSSAMDWAIFEDKPNGIFKVNRRAFVDPEVLRLERERIFDRCWMVKALHVAKAIRAEATAVCTSAAESMATSPIFLSVAGL